MLHPRLLIAGRLYRQYTLLPDGGARLDVPGGNLLYAAAGARLWEEAPIGLLARISADYPEDWLQDWEKHNLDTRGIHRATQTFEQRFFLAYSDRQTRHTDDPIRHFARRGMPFPPSLLGYSPPEKDLDSRTQLAPISIRQGDIPADYLDARGVHICPIDYLTHNLLPATFHQANVQTVTLDPSRGYMNPTFWEQIPTIVTGLTAFLPSEDELRALFQGRSEDLWEMAAAIASYGCDIVVIKRGRGGQWVYDAASHKRWEIPAYPSREMDPTGAGDAFAGGLLAAFCRTFDPLEAALYGNVAASLTIEGSDPFYALDALPGLAQARLETLRTEVHQR
ncbi:MAG: carbohydrate kinase family protein [Anaerolineae bacterium]|nr:MAG: carbohydrate kinase family protein [Anaerolineae bacterium]